VSKRIGIAIVLLLLAASAGISVASARANASTSSGLCAEVGSIQSAKVTRVIPSGEKYAPFRFSSHLSISIPARARALASAICNLPPRGWYSCPWGGARYLIRFNGQPNPVIVEAGACEPVTGFG
jgi:hypothetical protein